MKSLIKKQSTEIIQYDFEDSAGDGTDDFTSHDLPRPSLRLCQDLTPFCKRQHDKYIDGCEPGMIVNSGTRQIWQGDIDKYPDGGVVVLPIKYMNREIEWLPARGGFVAEHMPGSFSPSEIAIEVSADGKTIRVLKANGNIIVDTAIYHCFLLHESGSYDEIVIDMSSSQWGCAKDWNAFMRSQIQQSRKDPNKSFRLPMYSNVFRLFSKLTHRDDNSWFLWKVKHVQTLDLKDEYHQKLYQNAIEYKKLIEVGQVSVNREDSEL